MGLVRRLSANQKKTISSIRESKGSRAAIAEARRMGKGK